MAVVIYHRVGEELTVGVYKPHGDVAYGRYSTKQRKGLQRSRNWPQVGPTGPEQSLMWSLALLFWSFYALLWCIMSDLRSVEMQGRPI